MGFSIGVIQKAVPGGDFVDDIAELTGRPEILTWNRGTVQRAVPRGEVVESAKIPRRYQLRQFVIRLKTGDSMRVTGHGLKMVQSPAGTVAFVTVFYRSLTSTATVALVAADQVIAIVEEPVVFPPPAASPAAPANPTVELVPAAVSEAPAPVG